jgi:hypothetical protein
MLCYVTTERLTEHGVVLWVRIGDAFVGPFACYADARRWLRGFTGDQGRSRRPIPRRPQAHRRSEKVTRLRLVTTAAWRPQKFHILGKT